MDINGKFVLYAHPRSNDCPPWYGMVRHGVAWLGMMLCRRRRRYLTRAVQMGDGTHDARSTNAKVALRLPELVVYG